MEQRGLCHHHGLSCQRFLAAHPQQVGHTTSPIHYTHTHYTHTATFISSSRDHVSAAYTNIQKCFINQSINRTNNIRYGKEVFGAEEYHKHCVEMIAQTAIATKPTIGTHHTHTPLPSPSPASSPKESLSVQFHLTVLLL